MLMWWGEGGGQYLQASNAMASSEKHANEDHAREALGRGGEGDVIYSP